MKKIILILGTLIIILLLSSCDYRIKYDKKNEAKMINKAVESLENLKTKDSYLFSLGYDDTKIYAFKLDDIEIYVEESEMHKKYFYNDILYVHDKEKGITREMPYEFDKLNTQSTYHSLLDTLINEVKNTSDEGGMYSWFPTSGRSWITRENVNIRVNINNEEKKLKIPGIRYSFDRDKNLIGVGTGIMLADVSIKVTKNDVKYITQLLPNDLENDIYKNLGLERDEDNNTKSSQFDVNPLLILFLVSYVFTGIYFHKKIKVFKFYYIIMFIFTHLASIIMYMLGVAFLLDHITLTIKVAIILQSPITFIASTTSYNTLLTYLMLLGERRLRHKSMLRVAFASTMVLYINFIILLIAINVMELID